MDVADRAIEMARIKKEEREANEIQTALNLTDHDWQTFVNCRETFKPNLSDISLMLDDLVVGEHEVRMSLFTNFILSDIPVFVKGPSAGGKSQVMDACLETLMPGHGVLIEGGSDKVIFEMQNEINKGTHVEIREVNKVNEMVFEILKSWGEGKTYEYKRAKVQGGYQPFTLDAKPFVMSRADESMKSVEIPTELYSRLVELTINGKQNQTKAVLQRQAADKINPFAIRHVDKLHQAYIKWHISNLVHYDQYINPAAESLIEFIPTMFTTARRDYPKYLKNIDGITRFYWKERMTATIQDQSVIFSTPQDIFLNHRIFGKTLIDSAIRCSTMEQFILKAVKAVPGATKDELRKQLRKWDLNVALTVVDSQLKKLEDVGYIQSDRPSKKNIYYISDFYQEFNVTPNVNKIIKTAKKVMNSIDLYQPYADEYIERYCSKESLFVKDPFTGERINICEYEFEDVNDINIDEQSTRINTEQSEKEKQSGLETFL